MSVLALETNREQADAIRQACGLAGTSVSVVENAADLLAALHAHPPSLVLLPPLVPAADEAAVIDVLRSSPTYGHVEVLVTPTLAAPSKIEPAARGWLRRRGRAADQLVIGADAAAFAERLGWSLDRVRQRGAEYGHASDPQPGVVLHAGDVPVDQTMVPPSSLLSALDEVMAESGHDLHELRLADATTRLLQKLQDDRRSHRRFSARELQGLQEARIRFGPRVALIDLSAGGALLESDSRFQPDAEAQLELAAGDGKIVVPFRVLRSHVAGLNGSPRYRGACAFKSLLNVDGLVAGTELAPDSMALVPPPHLRVCNAW